MKNKKNVFLILIFIISIIILFSNKKYEYYDNTKKELELSKEQFAIYLQESKGSSNYPKKTNNVFPNKGYLLNTTKTKCNDYNGNNITGAVTQNLDSYGSIDGTITLKSNKSIFCNIYFDIDNEITAPGLTLKGKDVSNQEISNGYTAKNTITYTITWNDTDITQYCIAEGNSCTNWQSIGSNKTISSSITLSTANGTKTITVKIKDKANNEGSKSGSIILDTTPPASPTLTITGSSSSPSGYTLTVNPTYKVSWVSTDNVKKYCITNSTSSSSCTWDEASGTTGSKTTPALTGSDGSKTMYAFTQDEVGNISTYGSGTIKLDTLVPTATIDFVSNTENSITVKVGGSDANGINTSKMYCRKKGGNSFTANKDGTCTVTGLSAGNTYTIEAYVYDNAGRESSVTSKDLKTAKKPYCGQPSGLRSYGPSGLSTVELGDMYRFVGTKNAVDNYICFGYNDASTDCTETSEYMYRIIGITSTGEMKLIKNTAIKEGSNTTFTWNKEWDSSCDDGSCIWPKSLLFKRLNGLSSGAETGGNGTTDLFVGSTEYSYMAKTTSWYSKIVNHSWWYGDTKDVGYPANQIYLVEIGKKEVIQEENGSPKLWSSSQKVTAKIGLMYLHDYYYSSSVDYKDDKYANCYSYHSSEECLNSWLLITNNGKEASNQTREYTIVRKGKSKNGYYYVWDVRGNEVLPYGLDDTVYTRVRPVFYVSSSIWITTGNGTATEPFLIKPSSGVSACASTDVN